MIFEGATAYRSPCARVRIRLVEAYGWKAKAFISGQTFLTIHLPEYFEQVSYDLI